MLAFHVIDLESQARAVARHIRGWKKSDILTWLSQFGGIVQPFPDNPNLYRFRSYSGITTGFLLTDSGEFAIILDHTTWVVPPD
jgi:hypothetical protein